VAITLEMATSKDRHAADPRDASYPSIFSLARQRRRTERVPGLQVAHQCIVELLGGNLWAFSGGFCLVSWLERSPSW
jgi:hypothetical protein